MFNLKHFDVIKYIDFKWLFISLALGIFFVYIWNPEPTVIFVYPNSENSNKLQVKDLTDNCFKFKPEIIECPSDKSKITQIPIQNGINSK